MLPLPRGQSRRIGVAAPPLRPVTSSINIHTSNININTTRLVILIFTPNTTTYSHTGRPNAANLDDHRLLCHGAYD